MSSTSILSNRSYLDDGDLCDLEVLLEPLLDGLLEPLVDLAGVVALHPLGRDADVALLPAHVVLVLQLRQEVLLVHLGGGINYFIS